MFLWEDTGAKSKLTGLEILRFIRLMKVESHEPFQSCVAKSDREHFLKKQLDFSPLNFAPRVCGEHEFSVTQGWVISCLLPICKALTYFINMLLILQPRY